MTSYYLDIPIAQWDLYMNHVTKKIYGISDEDFKIVHERNGIRRIKFKINSLIPLANSLPTTIRNADEVCYFEDKDRLDKIKNYLQRTGTDYYKPGGVFYSEPESILLEDDELENVVRQLCRDQTIDRFIQLSGNRYLISMNTPPMIMILKVCLRRLQPYVCDPITLGYGFDIDDGYYGLGIAELNSHWRKWRDTADFTLPIYPPNIV